MAVVERKNANPTGLTIEQIEADFGTAFVDHLVKYKRERFNSPNDRHEVICSDPIAIFVCERYIEEITAKPYKFCDPAEEEGFTEIMMDIKNRWVQLNMKEIEMKIYPKWAGDGYCLTQMKPDVKNGLLDANAFGYFESPPDYWKRVNMRGTPMHNAIYEYYINYVPVPNGYQYMGNYNIHAEIEYKHPTDPGFFHFYRKQWNYGIGKPRLQGVWASLTKLRKISHADYKRKCIFNILEYPEDMDVDLPALVEAARRADEMEGMAIPKRINPASQETEDFPRIFDRTWDQEGAAPGGDASAGGTLLRNPEYARVLTALGYTETKLVGSQPGAVTGSKLDLTRDDEVDIREFNLWKSVIKDLLRFLLEIGALEGCDPESLERIATDSYDIKCHTEYEVLENQMMAAEMAEQQAMQEGGQQTMNADYSYRYNMNVQQILFNSLRYNFTMPMTPVLSSWIKSIGAEDGTVYMQTKKRTKQGIDTYAYPVQDEESLYSSWVDSNSKGGYWWDAVRDILSPAFKYGAPPAYLETGYGSEYETTAEQKMFPDKSVSATQPGTSRDPFTTPKSQWTSDWNTTDTGGFETAPKEWSQLTPGRVSDPSSITGSKKTGPGRKRKPGKSKTRQPVNPYNPSTYTPPTLPRMNSQSFIEMVGQDIGWGMSHSTAQKIIKLIQEVEASYNFRFNSITIGNPMDFDVVLRYNNPQDPYNPFEEKVCKKEWKKINAHTGFLYLYRDLGHGGDKHIVGKYDYWWDDKEDRPQVKLNYEDGKIKELLKGWGKEDSVIMDRVNKNLPVSMSTEYYCAIEKHNGVKYQVKFRDSSGEPRFNGIAIVERGNCDAPFCNFEVVE